MNYLIPIIVVFFGSVFGAIAALFLKKGSKKGWINITIIIGLFLYGISAIIFIGALKYAPVSVLSPVAAATYIWSFVFAKRYLKESINPGKIFGLSLIIAGIIVMALSQI